MIELPYNAWTTTAKDHEWLNNLKVGDPVERWLGGFLPMRLEVTELKGDRIRCALWEFAKSNGAEIDEDIGWGPTLTGSVIRKPFE